LFAWLISTREETNLENFIQLGYTLRDQELTLLKLIGAYILGGLLFLPITLLISATVIVFGPFFGFGYAFLGALVSSIVTFGVGMLLKSKISLNWEIKGLKYLNKLLSRQGILSIFLARNLLILPFSFINICAGATRISFRDYLIGTILGLLPNLLALAIFADRVVSAIVNPNWINILLALLLTVILLFFWKQLNTRITNKELSNTS
jgi:uncharacterized membrane protein YdjX (TVP38/TMEM64 family)